MSEPAPVLSEVIIPRAPLLRAVLALSASLPPSRRKKGRYSTPPPAIGVSAGDGFLMIRAASAACEATASFPCSGVLSETWANPKVLADVLRGTPGDVVLSAGKGGLNITAEGAEFALDVVTEGAPALPVTDAPVTEIPASILLAAIDRVWHSIAPDDNRYGLNGIHLRVMPGEVEVASTDGNRLSIARFPLAVAWETPKGNVIPKALVAVLRAMLKGVTGAVALSFPPKRCRATWEGGTVDAKMDSVQFPDYPQIVPETSSLVVTADRDALLVVLTRVGRMAKGYQNPTRLTLSPGRMALRTRTADRGMASASVPIGLVGTGITFGVNGGFLCDALRVLPAGPVTLGMNGVLAPIRVRSLVSGDVEGVVMPCRID